MSRGSGLPASAGSFFAMNSSPARPVSQHDSIPPMPETVDDTCGSHQSFPFINYRFLSSSLFSHEVAAFSLSIDVFEHRFMRLLDCGKRTVMKSHRFAEVCEIFLKL